jgi:predicted Fe-Mo cluster-binding NifX family protein
LEEYELKICISSIQSKDDSVIDKRFGRCPFFAIYDSETKKFEFVENSGANESHGAGLKAAQIIVDKGVEVMITGQIGPNAMKALNSANVNLFEIMGNTIMEQVKYYQENKLTKIDTPSTPHSGMGMQHGKNK